MKWVMFFVIIGMISSISGKLDKIISRVDDVEIKYKNTKKDNSFSLSSYVNKEVCIEIDNDDIYNEYLFSSMYNTVGKIIDYDNEWLMFEYLDKSKNKVINKYFRIRDIVVINEIK